MILVNWHIILQIMMMALAVISCKAHAIDIEANFDGRLESPNAIVFFHHQNEVHARRVLEILDLATHLVANRLPHSGGKVTAYIYSSDNEMAQGLTAILKYTPMEVKVVLKVGISEQHNNTLHIHKKTAEWGSFLIHAIVDEHVHGVIQNIYGNGPAESATWIEEGLTSYLAHELLLDKLKDFHNTYPERRFKVAFKALMIGRLPKLEVISTRNQWYSNIIRSHDAWNTQYALAYFSVTHLIHNYGFESVLNILSDVESGLTYKDSLERVTGAPLPDYERSMHFSLLYTGIVHLYVKYVVFILAILIIIVMSMFYIRWIRRRTKAMIR